MTITFRFLLVNICKAGDWQLFVGCFAQPMAFQLKGKVGSLLALGVALVHRSQQATKPVLNRYTLLAQQCHST